MTITFAASAATLFYAQRYDTLLCASLSQFANQPILAGWEVVSLYSPDGTITLTKRVAAPGNKVAVLKLQILNFLEQQHGNAIERHPSISTLLTADYAVGIVCEPNLQDDDQRRGQLTQLVQISEGVVFDGATLVNSALQPL